MGAIDKGVSGVLEVGHFVWNSGWLKPQAVICGHSAAWRTSFLLLAVSLKPQFHFHGVYFSCWSWN